MQRVADEESRREKARSVYAGAWLRKTEEDLQECCEQHCTTKDGYVHSNMEAFMEVLCEKIKLHYEAMGTFDTVEAVVERRRVCTEFGLLSKEDQHLVNGVADPLPLKKSRVEAVSQVEENHEVDEGGSEDDGMFITQFPSEHSSKAPLKRDDWAMSKELLRMHSTHHKRVVSFSQPQTPKNPGALS